MNEKEIIINLKKNGFQMFQKPTWQQHILVIKTLVSLNAVKIANIIFILMSFKRTLNEHMLYSQVPA